MGGGLGYLDVSVAGVQLGPATYLPRVEPSEVRYEIADDLSWAKGKHMIKFGMTFEHVNDNVNYLSNRYGSYTYPTVTSFAQDYTGNTTGAKDWSAYSQTFGNPLVDYSIKDIGFYLQDQWKVSDRLSLTLGARYEHSFMPPPPAANPGYPLTGATLHTGNVNLMPRIGLAYRLNEKTVIRAGVGTFFARIIGGMLDDVYTGNGIYQISDSLTSSNATLLAAGPVFPERPRGAGHGDHIGRFHAGRPQPEPENALFRTGQHRSGTADRQGHGGHRFRNLQPRSQSLRDARTSTLQRWAHPTPTPSPARRPVSRRLHDSGLLDDGAAEPEFRRYLRGNQWRQQLVRRPLVASVQKRFTHGFQADASYTWSHEIDDGQGAATNAIFGFSDALWTYNGQYGFDKGSGSLDQRQRLPSLVRVGAHVDGIPAPHSPNM